MELISILFFLAAAVLFIKLITFFIHAGFFLVTIPFKIIGFLLFVVIIVPLGIFGALAGILILPVAIFSFFFPLILLALLFVIYTWRN